MSSEETLENEAESGEEPSDADAGSEALAGVPGEGMPDEGAGKKTLGLERWVQLAFVLAALLLIWLFDHLISGIWYFFADPDEALVTAGSFVAGFVTTVALYRHKPSYAMVHDVVDELSKVTWPTRKETSSSTVVVVITSVVAGLILFMFDTVWSAVTDLVYKV